jgi:hypothetical protein
MLVEPMRLAADHEMTGTNPDYLITEVLMGSYLVQQSDLLNMKLPFKVY